MHNYDGYGADVTDQIIACAIEVHRHLGPGLLESVYESAMCLELKSAGVLFRRQVGVPVTYKGELIAEHRPDLVVSDLVVVEIKSVERFNPVFASRSDSELQSRCNEGRNSARHALREEVTLCLCGSSSGESAAAAL